MDQKNEYDPQMQMLFQPVMHIATKAEDILEDYPSGQSFAISAWTLDKGSKWKEDKHDAVEYLSEEPVHFSHDWGWNLECGKLWPERNKGMTVIAYTPVGAYDGCSLEEGVTCSYDMLKTQVDLLYTEPQADMDKVECHGLIVLPFIHALSQVDFRVKNRVSRNEEIIIKSISIDDVKYKGCFTSLPEPKWKAEDAESSILFYSGSQYTTNVPKNIGRVWNVIPQILSTHVTVEYEYRTSADTGFSLALKTCDLETNLKPGRHYTYTLSIGIDDVKFLQEIIEYKFTPEEDNIAE